MSNRPRMLSVDTNAAVVDMYVRHKQSLEAAAGSMLGDSDIAQDVVHEVFFRFLKSGHHLPPSRLRAYLWKAIRNETLHRIERKGIRQKLLLAQHFDAIERTTPDVEMEQRWIAGQIRSGFDALPPRCRDVATLALQDRCTLREVSVILGISVKTAKEQLRRARKKLRHTLADCAAP